MTLTDIKWDVFTSEERSIIESLVSSGNFNVISNAIQIDSMEKEYWISKIISQVKPLDPILDSEVEKEMLNERVKGNNIDSPEKEAEWQAKLDEEKTSHKTKISKRKKEAEEKEMASKETEIVMAKTSKKKA